MKKMGAVKLILLLGFLTILSVGCSHKVVVAPQLPDMMGQEKAPIDVGLFLSNELNDYRLSEYRKGDRWDYENLGQASAKQFICWFNQMFRSVVIVGGRPPITQTNTTLDVVIEPIIDQFTFDIPWTKFHAYPASIHYRMLIYDMGGNVLSIKLVEGVGDVKGSPGFDFTENPSRAASKAIEDGVENALKILVNSPEIKRLQDK